MKILMFAGSLRKDSFNKKLIRVVDKFLEKNSDVERVIVDLQELQFPVYDGDIEAKGIPAGVQTFAKHVAEADAIIISSPEYNGSISGVLKNAIDWTSRVKPMPLSKKPILLLGASPGALGAIRALGHDRAPFEALGNFLYPQPFGLAHADAAFGEDNTLKDPTQQERVQKLVNDFLSFSNKLD